MRRPRYVDGRGKYTDNNFQNLGLRDLPTFHRENLDGESFTEMMNRAYEETVKWKCNLFEVPKGRAGTLFVREMSRLLDAYSDAPAKEGIALKTAMVLAALLL